MTPLFITLGSNIEPERHLVEAVRMLREWLVVRAVSRVYRTTAINEQGKPGGQDDFLNAAVLVESAATETPETIKSTVLRPIEDALGRVRTEDKFAARTIDLDIALWGDRVVESETITLPDPDILTRAHVAVPLADLMADFIHPITGESLGEIAERLKAGAKLSTTDITLE